MNYLAEFVFVITAKLNYIYKIVLNIIVVEGADAVAIHHRLEINGDKAWC